MTALREDQPDALRGRGDDLPDCFITLWTDSPAPLSFSTPTRTCLSPTEELIDNYMPKYKELLESKGRVPPESHGA